MKARLHRRDWTSTLPALATLFLLTVVGRFVLVSLYAESVPYWDQWDAEGDRLLKPWVEGKLRFADLFSAHNEHRIAFTRLLSLVLFEANQGQWDNLVSAYANIVVYACVALLIYAVLRPGLSSRIERLALLLALILLAWLPYGHTNALVGFQNQFYFMTGLAVATIAFAALGKDRALTPAVVASLAVLGLFTMASGLLAAVAAGGVLMARAWRGEIRRSTALGGTGVLAAITVAGYVLVPHIAGHDPLKATGIMPWLQALGLNTAWPLGFGYGAALIWAPFAISTWRFVYRRGVLTDDLPGLGIGAWALLQCAAIAYSRGNEMTVVGSRYVDTLAIGLVANFWLVMRLCKPLTADTGHRWRRAAAWAALILYALIVFGALVRHAPDDLAGARQKNAMSRIQTGNVREFVAAGNVDELDQPFMHIPYPDSRRLSHLLSDPTLRAALPASVRAPLTITSGRASGGMQMRDPARPGYAISSCAPQDCAGGIGTWHGPLTVSRFRYVLVPLVSGGDASSLSLRISTMAPLDETFFETRAVRTLLLPVPPGNPFRLVAADTTRRGWLAFDAPIEVGRLSAMAMRAQAILGERAVPDDQRHAIELPVASVEGNSPLRLDGLQSVSGNFRAPRPGILRGLSVFIGNYHGSADGDLVVELCSRTAGCAQARNALPGSIDNSYFAMRVANPIMLEPDEMLEFRITTEHSTRPVALWTYPAGPASPRLRPSPAVIDDVASSRTLRIRLVYLD